MLVQKLKQPERPDLFLLPPETDDRETPGRSAAYLRLRLRKWEVCRTWSGRALVALSFPMAYLLVMLTTETPAPISVVRFVLHFWIAAVTAAAVCAEAVWRNRTRLEHMARERVPDRRG